MSDDKPQAASTDDADHEVHCMCGTDQAARDLSHTLYLTEEAQVLSEAGSFEQARAVLDRAWRLVERAGAQGSMTAASISKVEAYWLQQQGQFQPAYDKAVAALAIASQHLGDDHPMVAVAMLTVADVACDLGAGTEAESFLTSAVAKLKAARKRIRILEDKFFLGREPAPGEVTESEQELMAYYPSELITELLAGTARAVKSKLKAK